MYFLKSFNHISENLEQKLQKVFFETMIQTNQLYKNLTCSLSLVSEEEIKGLNLQTRNIDKVTDVLSYPLLDCKVGEPIDPNDYPYDIDEDNDELSLGDIVICENVAKAQAIEYENSLEREFCYLFVHGLLHLLGYDHMQEDDKALMRAMEEKILGKENILR